MIKVNLSNTNGIVQTGALSQWDFGQVMEITGLSIEDDTEVHFANHGEDEAIIVMGKYEEGVLIVEIPDISLTKGTDIFVFVYESSTTAGRTIRKARIPITKRAKPVGYTAPNAQDYLMRLLEEAENTITESQKIVTEATIDRQNLEAALLKTTRAGTVVATTDSAKAKPKNIKLFGKSEQDGTPSIEASIEIQSHGDSGSIVGKVLGKNLYIGRYYYMHYSSGKIYIENENSVVFPYTPADETRGVCKIVQCIAGEKYTLYASNPNTNAWLGITEYTNIDSSFNDNNSVDFAQNVGSGESITYIAKTNGILLCGISGKWTDGSTSIHTCTEDEEVQVEIGDVATSYEKPYTEQPFTALTPNGLRGIPLGQTIPDAIKNSPIHMAGVYWDNTTSQYYIGDTVEYESGEYVQRIIEFGVEDFKNISVSGDSKWYDSNLSYSYECNNQTFGAMLELTTGLSTHFIGYVFNAFYNHNIETGFMNNLNYLVLNISKSYGICTTPDEFKQWCIDNDVKFAKILANPIITDLTKEELDQYNALLMNYPNTTVVNDAGAYMEVEYVADTKEHIKQNYVAKSEHEALKERVSEIENVIANL